MLQREKKPTIWKKLDDGRYQCPKCRSASVLEIEDGAPNAPYCPKCGACLIAHPYTDDVTLSVEDALETIRDMAIHPGRMLMAQDILDRFEREYMRG